MFLIFSPRVRLPANASNLFLPRPAAAQDLKAASDLPHPPPADCGKSRSRSLSSSHPSTCDCRHDTGSSPGMHCDQCYWGMFPTRPSYLGIHFAGKSQPAPWRQRQHRRAAGSRLLDIASDRSPAHLHEFSGRLHLAKRNSPAAIRGPSCVNGSAGFGVPFCMAWFIASCGVWKMCVAWVWQSMQSICRVTPFIGPSSRS